jgi:hypothetical protein
MKVTLVHFFVNEKECRNPLRSNQLQELKVAVPSAAGCIFGDDCGPELSPEYDVAYVDDDLLCFDLARMD